MFLHFSTLPLLEPKVIILCKRYRTRPACTSVQWHWPTFKFILISLKTITDSSKNEGGLFHFRNLAGYGLRSTNLMTTCFECIYASMLQFIDLCILLGCDYCESIRGIGPKRAIDLIKQYKTIDEIMKHLDMKVRNSDWIFCYFLQI